jgi:aspartate kinase
VALAAALQAERCEIYTDVDGVYTADPNVCPAARKLDRISYEEMLEEASLGAKVLQIRSVEFAMKYRVPLWVKSSFGDDPGTLVCEEDAAMEDVLVSGITYDRNEARLVLRGVPDRPGWRRASSERSTSGTSWWTSSSRPPSRTAGPT